MNTAFNLTDFDDGPTLVMHREMTQIMDRRQFPPSSGVMPIARPAPPPPPPRYVAPAADATQPALRIRREAAGFRRLAIVLAIGAAFAGGLAAAYFIQMANPAPIVATSTREPRTVTDRASSLDTRSAPLLRPASPQPTIIVRSATTTPAPATTADEAPAPAEDLEGHDLLKEGL